LNEVHSLDVELEKSIEAYNHATEQLAQIERERAVNRGHLRARVDSRQVCSSSSTLRLASSCRSSRRASSSGVDDFRAGGLIDRSMRDRCGQTRPPRASAR
jgi:hypothetical protein